MLRTNILCTGISEDLKKAAYDAKEIRAVQFQPVLSLMRCMSRSAILLENKVCAMQIVAVLDQKWKQMISVICCIYLDLLWNKMQTTLSIVADAS